MEENPVSVTPPEQSVNDEGGVLGFSAPEEERIEAPESPRSQSLGAMAVIDLALTMAIMLVASVIFARTGDVAVTELLALGVAGAHALSATLWWRNAYVINRSIKWDGNISVAISSVVAVIFGMITVAWFLELQPQRAWQLTIACLLYTSPSPRDQRGSRMPSSA